MTLVYGEAGVGKTNLCLQVSARVALSGSKVLFLDTDGVSIERLAQICQGQLEAVLPSLLFLKSYDLQQQHEQVLEAARIVAGGARVGLVVVDGVGTLFRPLASSEKARQALASLVGELQSIARRHHIPVLATTQVYADIDRQQLAPIGGHVVHYLPRCILHFERLAPHRRRATLVKHGHQPEGRWCEFVLGPVGIADPPEGLLLGAGDPAAGPPRGPPHADEPSPGFRGVVDGPRLVEHARAPILFPSQTESAHQPVHRAELPTQQQVAHSPAEDEGSPPSPKEEETPPGDATPHGPEQ